MRALFLHRRIDTNNGITSYVETLMSGLAAKGVAVDLVCSELHRYPNDEGRWRGLLTSASSLRCAHWLREIPTPFAIISMIRLLRQLETTVVNIHGLGMLIWGKMISVTTGLPVVATYHPSVHGEVDAVAGVSRRPMTSSQRFVLRWCAPDRLIVLSVESAAYLTEQCPSLGNRVVVVGGAVDENIYRLPTDAERSRCRAQLGLAEDELAILQVGRMSWNKGQDLLIDAIRNVRARANSPQVRCFFVGSGNDERAIHERAFAREGDLKSFRFLGFVDDLREVLWAGDIFVLPSRLEGFALAVVEAMAAGLVAIRTPSGGATDQIVNNVTGFIVPFEDSDAIADAIECLADDDVRDQFRSRSIAHTQARFTKSAMSQRMIELYTQVSR